MPEFEAGNIGEVAKRAEQVCAKLLPLVDEGYDVVTLTASCGLMMKFEWPLILPETRTSHHVFAKPEGDIDRTRDGKTSSVHFLRFPLTEAHAQDFRDASKPVMVGRNHPQYGHLAVLSNESRAELDKDID